LTNRSNGPEIAELSAAFTTALTLICNRLIEGGALDRDQIKADLAGEVETIRQQEPSVLKEMILSGLAFALHAPPSPQESTRSGRERRPYGGRLNDVTHLDEIDGTSPEMKLIGRDD
jgi:hypothetical protein